jgi:hypothetical protein
MKLHEIIEANEDQKKSLNIQLMLEYKNSLHVYYKNILNSEPILMVTDVFNACSFGKIVDSDSLHEAIEMYIEDEDTTEEEKEQQREIINFNSVFLITL